MGSLRSLRTQDKQTLVKETKQSGVPEYVLHSPTSDGFSIRCGEISIAFSTASESRTFWDKMLRSETFHLRADLYERGMPKGYLLKSTRWTGKEYRNLQMQILNDTLSVHPHIWTGVLDFPDKTWEIVGVSSHSSRKIVETLLKKAITYGLSKKH
jgi:hypothetical protein